MAASLSSLRQFRTPLQSLSGFQSSGSANLFCRHYTRSRKSRLDYLGMKAVWERPVPQSEWINPSTKRPWSKQTMERRLRQRPIWSITSEELRHIRQRYNTGPRVKVPIHLRPMRPAPTVDALREQEKQRILTEFPREIDQFKAGDRIEVHRYVELGKPKIEVIKGICVARRHGGQVHSTFKLLNVYMETPFIMTYPVYSPYLTKIKLIEKGKWSRNRLNHLKDLPHEQITTK